MNFKLSIWYAASDEAHAGSSIMQPLNYLDAVDALDVLITDTANASTRIAVLARENGLPFDAINAGTATGIRLQALIDAKAHILKVGAQAYERGGLPR